MACRCRLNRVCPGHSGGCANRSSSQELLDQLKQLFEKTGVLTRDVIAQTAGMPSVQTYVSRFGGLRRAYELIGYWPTSDPDHQEANRRIRRMHPEIIERTHAAIAKWGGSVWRDPKTDLMHVNQELIICVLMARCHTDISGEQCWRVRFDSLGFFYRMAERMQVVRRGAWIAALRFP
jgi:hypothetical protein